MLLLTRKVGESIRINDDIEITLTKIQGNSVTLGFTYPSHVKVLRKEIYERIAAENRLASKSILKKNQLVKEILKNQHHNE